MPQPRNKTDTLTRLLGCLAVALLAFLLNSIDGRVAALEKNQVRLMVALGVEPVAYTPEIGVKPAFSATILEIKKIKNPQKRP